MSNRILIVDDDRDMCDLLESDLRRRGFQVTTFTSAADAFDHLGGADVDVVMTDLNMPGMNGVEFCERVGANRPDIPVIVLTAFGSMDAAVATIRAGAYDFVTKPVDTDLLVIALERALRHRAMQERIRVLSEAGERDGGGGPLIGDSRPMQELKRQIERIAGTDASVLISGESGTGKELVARTLHERSARHVRPFVAINCAALPETLLESELFGHKRGAFTDARADRKGLILEADGGTLLLDEIGEMAVPLQPKLLRALEERRLRPVGGGKEVPFDIRVVAATNRDLESAVENGSFRKDLYYRLNVIQLHVPPLRSRGTDALLLANIFLAEFAERFGKPVTGLSDPTSEKLLNYGWPGNVRELRNAMERAVALARYDRIAPEDLPEKIRDYQPSRIVLDGGDPQDLLPMEEVERRYIRHVLEATAGNRTLAARILGFDRKTLYRKLQRYESEEG